MLQLQYHRVESVKGFNEKLKNPAQAGFLLIKKQ